MPTTIHGETVPFTVVVRHDPAKALHGKLRGYLLRDQLWLQQRMGPASSLPVGAPVRFLSGNRFVLPLEGRDVELGVAGLPVHSVRLAYDLCRFLQGLRGPLRSRDYTFPRFWVVLAALAGS